MKKKLSIVFVVVLAGFIIWFISNRVTGGSELINGKPAVEFKAERLDGATFELSDLEGYYVLLDFWASWCRPCRKNNPKLVNLYGQLQEVDFKDAEGFEIISIAVDEKIKSLESAIQSDQLNWPYHVLDSPAKPDLDNGTIAEKYGVKEIPSTFLIDPQGKIIGVDLSARKLELLLEQQLKQN